MKTKIRCTSKLDKRIAIGDSLMSKYLPPLEHSLFLVWPIFGASSANANYLENGTMVSTLLKLKGFAKVSLIQRFSYIVSSLF